GAMLVPGPLLRYYCVASSGGHDPITGCARDIEQAAGVFVNHHRIAARDAGESSHDLVGENVLGFAGAQLMANECDDFVRAELLEAKAGDEQPLSGRRGQGPTAPSGRGNRDAPAGPPRRSVARRAASVGKYSRRCPRVVRRTTGLPHRAPEAVMSPPPVERGRSATGHGAPA